MLILDAFDTTKECTVNLRGVDVKIKYDTVKLEEQIVEGMRWGRKVRKGAKKSKKQVMESIDPLESVEYVFGAIQAVVKAWDIKTSADADFLPINEKSCFMLSLEACGDLLEQIKADYEQVPKGK